MLGPRLRDIAPKARTMWCVFDNPRAASGPSNAAVTVRGTMSDAAHDAPISAQRPVYLTREGGHFRLAFPYERGVVDRVKAMPYARFDRESRSWTVPVCTQVLEALRLMDAEGLCDVAPDDLLAEGERVHPVAPAVLRSGTDRRPFRVQVGIRDERLFSRLRTVPGSSWDKGTQSLTYPPTSAAALGELVDRGVVADPDKVLSPSGVSVSFDARSGRFVARGDRRAQAALDKYFPGTDVVAAWVERGLDAGFADSTSEEIYRGELARTADSSPAIAGLQEPLFEYQARNVAVALERSGLGVWDAPGLGKTATGIGWGHELVVNRSEAQRVVVVCPATLRTQWAREISRFTGAEDVVVVDGDSKKRRRAYQAAADARWVVLHWDILSRDLAQIEPLVRGAALVFDEAHRAKSHTAQRTKAANKLSRVAGRRLALSGTPVVNRPDEWYAVLSLAVPGCLGAPLEFMDRYMYRGRFGGFEGARNLEELRERSRIHFIRHTKSEVATHLPPLLVEHQPLDATARYAALLRQVHRDARDEIRAAALERAGRGRAGRNVLDGYDNEEVAAGAEMTAVGMLRLICSSPRLLQASDSTSAEALIEAGLVPDEDGPKMEWLRERAGEWQLAGERAVVFTFSKRMADLICERFAEDGIRHVSYTGSTSDRDREAAVAAFTSDGTEDDPGPTCFVATDAAAEGLNLGRHCSLLVNVDVPWQPAVLEQRSNRIHRVDGTHSSYLVVNLTVAGTMEEGLVRMISRKVDLADTLLGEQGGRDRTVGRRRRGVRTEDYLAGAIDEHFQEIGGP